MNEKEARALLSLPKTGALDKTKVETEFKRLFRAHQARLNSALNPKGRETEAKILTLLREARNICMGIGSARQPSRSTPVVSPQHGCASGAPNNTAPTNQWQSHGIGDVQRAANYFGSVFVHLWLVLKSLGYFVLAVPSAVVGVKDCVCEMFDRLQVAGIPKIVVALALTLGVLPLINGCVHAIHKMVEWFK